jgi:hypothetical protein
MAMPRTRKAAFADRRSRRGLSPLPLIALALVTCAKQGTRASTPDASIPGDVAPSPTSAADARDPGGPELGADVGAAIAPNLADAADVVPASGPETLAAPDLAVPADDVGVQSGARLVIEPASLDFGTLDPGAQANPYLTVTNAGSETSGDLMISYGPNLFTTMGGRMPALSPGERNLISLTVRPTGEGAFSSWVTVAAEPGANPALQIAITGNVAPWGPFVASPMAVDFGKTSYGSHLSALINVTVREAVSDYAAKARGPYATIASTNCTASMAADTACVVSVDFYMNQAGSVSDSVELSAGGATPKRVTIPMAAHTDTSW